MGRCDGFWGDPYAPRYTWKNRWTRIGLALFISIVLLIIIIIVVATAKKDKGTTGESVTTPVDPTIESPPKGLDDTLRFDCTPDIYDANFKALEKECSDRNCIFDAHELKYAMRRQEAGDISSEVTQLVPRCYYPSDWYNYLIQSTKTYEDGSLVIILDKMERSTGFQDNVSKVKIQVIPIDDNRVRIKVTDVERDRWEPPLPVIDVTRDMKSNSESRHFEHSFDAKTGDLKITRKATNTVLFQTNLKKLIFADQFLQMIVYTPNNELYGLGGQDDNHLKKVTTKDEIAGRKLLKLHCFGDLPLPEKAGYGHHPFYLMYEDDGSAHGVWLHNINSMNILMTSTPALTFRTIGGILDFFVFVGPTPDDVMQQKAKTIGFTPLPPLWSLGFHLCRYGYNSSKGIMEVYKRNVDAGLPLDVQWADIDYMDTFNMFTYDKKNWENLPQFIEKLHKEGRKFVPILDPAVDGSNNKTSAGYPAYQDGKADDVYIKNPNGTDARGKVWNTIVSVFPDFGKKSTNDWWYRNLKKFHQVIQFDGLWIDMNEPCTFENEKCEGESFDKYDRPQFNPVAPMPLNNLTICMSSVQSLGPHYNLHNMYGLLEAKITHESLRDIRKKRTFIISRSTTSGSNVYANHWTGDVDSSWIQLKRSISQMLEFNLFGIPLVGADICGFVHDTNEELCSRWSTIGSFYGFARNHNDNFGKVAQDPASPDLGGVEGNVFKANMYGLQRRYMLLPYLYSLFFKNSLTGEPVVRSLRYNFPKEKELADNNYQFMWGKSLMINGITDKGKEVLEAQFPPGKWYNLESEEVIVSTKKVKKVNVKIPLTKMQLAARGGYIIPMHDPKQTTTDQRKGLFKVSVFLDESKKGFGDLYWDDGDSLNTLESKNYTHVKFTTGSNSLTSSPQLKNYEGEPYTDSKGTKTNTMRMKQVKIYGQETAPQKVEIEGENGEKEQLKFSYDPDRKIIVIPKDETVEWSVSLLSFSKISWE